MFINPNPVQFPFNPNEIAADGEPTGADSGTEPGTTPGTEPMPTYLTPDALLTYCETRLGNIDSQIQQTMQTAQNVNDDQEDLQPVQAALSKYADGCNDPSSVQQLTTTIQQAMTSIQARDPGSPALSALQGMLSSIQTGQSTGNAAAKIQLQVAQQMGLSVTGLPDLLTSEQMKNLSTTLSDATSNMNSSQEMTMISIQSLMGDRQTAVELTTNMLQNLDDTAEKVVSNVGR